MVMARAFSGLLIRGANTTPSFTNQRVGVEIGVLADHDTLERGPHEYSVLETADGLALTPSQVGRLCCDATLRRVTTGGPDRLSVSRAARTATPAQRVALLALYGGCAISGADWSDCEIHHVVYWEHDGPTDLDNLGGSGEGGAVLPDPDSALGEVAGGIRRVGTAPSVKG
ncbi:MAG: HNH endonuclease signature motif containing protein [Acidimicrobiales bacterium]